MSLRELSPDERPREKLLNFGKKHISNAELLAIIIGSGGKDISAVELANKILNENNHKITNISKLNVIDLKKFKNIGTAKAINILAALELGNRMVNEEIKHINKITCSNDIFKFIRGNMCDLTIEEFWAIYLDNSNKIISKEKISQGGINNTIVDHKVLLSSALKNKASSVIISHNHPSGANKPSNDDVKLTNLLFEKLKFFDIKLLDHIIIYDNNYYSFADNSLII